MINNCAGGNLFARNLQLLGVFQAILEGTGLVAASAGLLTPRGSRQQESVSVRFLGRA